MRILNKGIALLCAVFLLLATAGCGNAASEAETVGINGDLTIVFPKLGSADAALLMTEQATVLIDAGESNDGDEILELLDAYGRSSIDLLLISHYDKDHIGGAAEVIGGTTVSRVIGSTSPKESDEMTAYTAALSAAGLTEEKPTDQTIVLGGMVIHVDPPRKRSYTEDQSNNSSVVVSVTYGETGFFFGGDAMSARLKEITWPEQAYDLVKIPHHGRDAADIDPYLGSFRAGAYAIVTSSKKEPESDDLMAALQDHGIHTLRTRNGDIVVTSDGKQLTVTQ